MTIGKQIQIDHYKHCERPFAQLSANKFENQKELILSLGKNNYQTDSRRERNNRQTTIEEIENHIKDLPSVLKNNPSQTAPQGNSLNFLRDR